MPLLVVALVAEARLPFAQAGLIASAYMVGQMVTTLGLPALKFVRLRRSHAMVAVGLLLASALVSARLSSQAMIACWFVVGAACGALQFLGATTAAAAVNRQSAFTLRLAITLLVGGFAIVGLQAIGGFGGYALLMMQLAIVFSMITGLGLMLYRAPVPAPLAAPVKSGERPRQTLGLLVIFLLFAGQLGFWAYAVQNLQQRGVVLEHLAYAIAFCKTVAGLVLLIGVMRPPDKTKEGLFFPGLVVALGVLGMAVSGSALSFLLGLLLWELGLNVLSARLQAAVVQNNPQVAGPWLAGAVFLGAAAGPMLHGMTIQVQLPLVFAAYACCSAFIPVAWVYLRGHKAEVKPL
ncbi:MAG: hypothetical protein Q7T13_17785 [Polaromonas sp.]|nr:hypothetical protein [Polaromonas sp.]